MPLSRLTATVTGLASAGIAGCLLLVGCGGGTSSAERPPAVERTPAAHRCDERPGSITDLRDGGWRSASGRRWTTTEGCIVRNDVVADIDGPEHCGFQSARVIVVGHPVGERARGRDARFYVRDPENVFGDSTTASRLEVDAALPASAVDTSLRLGTTELWTIPDDPSWIYLRGAGTVERWPLDREPTFCA